MNHLMILISLLSLTLISAQDAPAAAPSPATDSCVELCKHDTGTDADTCMTECAVSTDLETHHLDEGLDNFVTDEAHNEVGGDAMREAHNEKAPEEVPECAPEPGYGADTKPEWETLDTNGDGVIDADEAFTFCEKACIPDELGQQLFSEADLNQDKVIDKDEFDAAGEDTKNEEAMDEVLEDKFEGDDESNTVQNPDLEEFDKDDSGDLDKNEVNDMYEHQVEQRTEHAPGAEETVEELQPEIDEAVAEVDTNGDGKISGDEFVADSDGGSDLGGELQEAADAEEDEGEQDDLPRAGTTPPPAMLISHSHQLRHRHSLHHTKHRHGQRLHAKRAGHHMQAPKVGHRLQAKKMQRKLKYAQAMLAEAIHQEKLRKASFAQHQRRLHRAMLMHKQAKRSGRGHRSFRHHRK
eukprot:gnl/MRDRNA2_/MRDRNA2_88925_c0_seq1.p1 gnl/MRDRNA2_/MRDRNA2_88925_c0~~gnl/MRDRNA2_/MRDRNA2_88925_c0_seq1.p1  ORF type:complete len:410 (-),score=127.04 gnl/MRDRNA2_/MRDRNA2_88925_c0_seq1:35-1264(-)